MLSQGIQFSVVILLMTMLYSHSFQTTAGIALIIYLYSNHRRNKVILDYQKNEWNHEILKRCPSLFNYKPTIYLNGFLHTVFATILPKDSKLTQYKEKIGNTGISVDWAAQSKESDTLLFILPGLTGSINDSYINAQVREALKQGFKNICVYNYRILSPEANYFWRPELINHNMIFTPNKFHEGHRTDGYAGIDTDYHFFVKECHDNQRLRVDLVADLHHTLTFLKQKYNFEFITAIGSSYGATQLCNYIGRFHDIALVNSAVSIGAPYSMQVCNQYLSYTMDKVLTNILKSKIQTLRHIFDEGKYPKDWGLDIDQTLKTEWLRDFDEAFITKIYGYKSVSSYYRHFSPINHIQNVKIPLLCISARDDSVCHPKGVCKDEILLNPRAILCMTGLGGHIGFVEGMIPKEHWFPKPAMEFLHATITSKQ